MPIVLGIFLFSIGLSGLAQAQRPDKEMLRWLRGKPKIDSIVVEGSDHFSAREVRSKMYSRVHSLATAIRGDRRASIQKETLARDTLEIKFLYLTAGFLGVRLRESFEMIGKDSAALVRVKIEEGRRFRYGPSAISGTFEPGFQTAFKKITDRLRAGRSIDFFELRKATFDLKTELANGGYPYAVVTNRIDTSSTDGTAPLYFNIESDSLVRFGEVTIEGIKRYPTYVARRELTIVPDDIYRRETILESQRRLFESGYFSTLQLQQVSDNADRLRPDFVLRVRARKPKFITFKTGAGQSEFKDLIWDFSAAFGKRNFFGSRRYDLLADYSFNLAQDASLITHRYRLRYTEPWFLGIRMPLLFTGEYRPRLKDPVLDFKLGSWSISASTRKKFGRKVRTELGIEYESINISGVADELEQLYKEQEGISVRRNIYFVFRRDSRDNLFIPRRGSVSELTGEYYGGFLGGDDNFTHISASWAKYQTAWPGWISATRLKVGNVSAFGSTDNVPLSDLLFLGGANTVRGFTENSLGPLAPDGSPAGAEFTAVFNQEFRWKTIQILRVIPIISDFFRSFPLWQSIFVDVGNGFGDVDVFKFSELAVSYGTGIQIVSPAGPIRIDYAQVIPTDKFAFADKWHFTILYAF